MRARLNLATKPLESHRRFLAGASLTAFVASVVFIGLGWHVYSFREAAKEVRARAEKIRQQRAEYEAQSNELRRYFAQKNVASLHDRADFINGVIAMRSFNWTQMFMDLERILPGGVHIISIEPKQVGGHVELNLTFGAMSDDVKVQFIRALESSKLFSDVQMRSDIPPSAPSTDHTVVNLSTFYLGS